MAGRRRSRPSSARLEDQRQAQAARLAERHLELRRLEILIERRARAGRAEAAWREQAAMDELAELRPARPRRPLRPQNSGASVTFEPVQRCAERDLAGQARVSWTW